MLIFLYNVGYEPGILLGESNCSSTLNKADGRALDIYNLPADYTGYTNRAFRFHFPLNISSDARPIAGPAVWDGSGSSGPVRNISADTMSGS